MINILHLEQISGKQITNSDTKIFVIFNLIMYDTCFSWGHAAGGTVG
jgi:hypothetical protein